MTGLITSESSLSLLHVANRTTPLKSALGRRTIIFLLVDKKGKTTKKKNIGQGQLQKTIRMIIVEGAGWIGWSISDGGFATTPTTKHQPELPEESSSPASMVTGGLSFLSAARSFSFLRCLLGCCGSHSFVTTVMTPKRQ